MDDCSTAKFMQGNPFECCTTGLKQMATTSCAKWNAFVIIVLNGLSMKNQEGDSH